MVTFAKRMLSTGDKDGLPFKVIPCQGPDENVSEKESLTEEFLSC